MQSTFELLAGRTEEFAHAFYERLFEVHPPSAALFADTDMATQRLMLMDMIGKAVQGLDKPEALLPVLRDLGRRHGTYGVQPGHYKQVGRVLLDVLERYLGEAFTPEVHLAWMEIYQLIASTMIDAGGSDADAAARSF